MIRYYCDCCKREIKLHLERKVLKIYDYPAETENDWLASYMVCLECSTKLKAFITNGLTQQR
jgi:hypothetical protein